MCQSGVSQLSRMGSRPGRRRSAARRRPAGSRCRPWRGSGAAATGTRSSARSARRPRPGPARSRHSGCRGQRRLCRVRGNPGMGADPEPASVGGGRETPCVRRRGDPGQGRGSGARVEIDQRVVVAAGGEHAVTVGRGRQRGHEVAVRERRAIVELLPTAPASGSSCRSRRHMGTDRSRRPACRPWGSRPCSRVWWRSRVSARAEERAGIQVHDARAPASRGDDVVAVGRDGGGPRRPGVCTLARSFPARSKIASESRLRSPTTMQRPSGSATMLAGVAVWGIENVLMTVPNVSEGGSVSTTLTNPSVWETHSCLPSVVKSRPRMSEPDGATNRPDIARAPSRAGPSSVTWNISSQIPHLPRHEVPRHREIPAVRGEPHRLHLAPDVARQPAEGGVHPHRRSPWTSPPCSSPGPRCAAAGRACASPASPPRPPRASRCGPAGTTKAAPLPPPPGARARTSPLPDVHLAARAEGDARADEGHHVAGTRHVGDRAQQRRAAADAVEREAARAVVGHRDHVAEAAHRDGHRGRAGRRPRRSSRGSSGSSGSTLTICSWLVAELTAYAALPSLL